MTVLPVDDEHSGSETAGGRLGGRGSALRWRRRRLGAGRRSRVVVWAESSWAVVVVDAPAAVATAGRVADSGGRGRNVAAVESEVAAHRTAEVNRVEPIFGVPESLSSRCRGRAERRRRAQRKWTSLTIRRRTDQASAGERSRERPGQRPITSQDASTSPRISSRVPAELVDPERQRVVGAVQRHARVQRAGPPAHQAEHEAEERRAGSDTAPRPSRCARARTGSR